MSQRGGVGHLPHLILPMSLVIAVQNYDDGGTDQSVTFMKVRSFFLDKRISEYIIITNCHIANCTNIPICLNNRLVFTLKQTLERMSVYIHTNKFETNQFPIIYVKEKSIQTNV